MNPKSVLFLAIVSTASLHASAADGFEGSQLSVGVNHSKYKMTGGEYYNLSSSADQSFGVADGVINKNDLKIGYSYGIKSDQFVTNIGIDYVPGTKTISNAIISPGSNGGPNGISIKNQYGLFIAPGYQFAKDSLSYFKIGTTHLSTSKLIDTSSGVSLNGGPGKTGTLFSIGFNQKFDASSPFFYNVELSTNSTKKAQVIDSTATVGYDSKIKSSNISFGVGVLY